MPCRVGILCPHITRALTRAPKSITEYVKMMPFSQHLVCTSTYQAPLCVHATHAIHATSQALLHRRSKSAELHLYLKASYASSLSLRPHTQAVLRRRIKSAELQRLHLRTTMQGHQAFAQRQVTLLVLCWCVTAAVTVTLANDEAAYTCKRRGKATR